MSKKKCEEILAKYGFSLESTIDFEVNKKPYSLSFSFIIDSFMSASDESRATFVSALGRAALDDGGIEKFFEAMGQLLLMTHLSKNISMP